MGIACILVWFGLDAFAHHAPPEGSSMPNHIPAPPCRVCLANTLCPYKTVGAVSYSRCRTCEAILLDPAFLPDRQTEEAEYRRHENDPDDPRYQAFLQPFVDAMLARIPPASCGLDYGCGNGSPLARMVAAAGHALSLYDPFFHPATEVLDQTYTFVCCTETAEHFHHPAEAFARLDRLLCPGGWLGVRTRFPAPDEGFSTWHYRRDPTHVVFYSETTFRHLAARVGWSCAFPAPEMVFFRKPGRESP